MLRRMRGSTEDYCSSPVPKLWLFIGCEDLPGWDMLASSEVASPPTKLISPFMASGKSASAEQQEEYLLVSNQGS